MQQQIDISKTTGVSCEECESQYFKENLMLRRASRIMTGLPKDQIVQLPILRCADCGHVNKEFKPAID